MEQQLLDVLNELENSSSREALTAAFAQHRKETQDHVDQLEGVFKAVGASAEAQEYHTVDGMIENHKLFTSRDPDQAILGRFDLTAGQQSEHYGIDTYGNLIPSAQQLSHDDLADSLEQILREGQNALDKLSEIGEGFDCGDLRLTTTYPQIFLAQ